MSAFFYKINYMNTNSIKQVQEPDNGKTKWDKKKDCTRKQSEGQKSSNN